MAEGSNHHPQKYTSFDQFIAQNDFSQLHNQNSYYANSNQQLYFQPQSIVSPTPQQYYNGSSSSNYLSNSYTLTADATEFVPRNYNSFYGAHQNGVPNGEIVPMESLTLSDSTSFATTNEGTSDRHEDTQTQRNSVPSGAIPKQHQSGRRKNQQQEGNQSRKPQQQQPPKNPKSGRRKQNELGDRFEDEQNNRQWNGHGEQHQQVLGKSTGHEGFRNSRSNRTNDSQPPLSHRGGRADKKPQLDAKRAKPTDFQPNRNLKRPERVLEHPVDISQREKQIVEIDAGHLECVICCEKIKSVHSTWNCKNCYSILHLNCTNKWASKSKLEEGWRCPTCQNPTFEIPHDYYCFCGKQKNPQYNRNDVAHSCGEVCRRKTNCDHPCTLLCHPGACPTCQASVTQVCGCGATTKTMICSQVEAITCDGVCQKTRKCGLHKCEKKCHTGDCDPCEETLVHECFCGRSQKNVPCTVENLNEMKYSCENTCGLELNCKNHKCQRQCHGDACRECDLTPDTIRACPCGKKPILVGERTSCLDEIPLCEAVCNKVLNCGAPSNPHRCISKCHLGQCPPCQKSTAVKCRCGQMDQMVKCKQLTTRADDARCKKKCTKKRSCGKHRCNVECCIDIDHICPLPCPSTLNCGKHKCERTCHPGHCLPCQRASFHELHCECGAQVLYPPVPCGTKKPTCDKPCSRVHVCTHPVLHNCHTLAVCPPCMIQTAKWCFGKHEQRRTIPCSQESFSCGMPCNKELPCKEHKCIKNCHEGECMTTGEICKQSCQKTRSICGHKCMAPCHTGDCPETMCKETVEVVCQCGNRKQNRLCHDFANEFKRIATAQLASSLQDMQSGSSNGLKELFAPIKWTTAKKIECDDSCAILERNRRMAIGLQIRNPDLGSKLHTKYSDYLHKWMKEDPKFIEMIHNKLTELVKLAKESKQKSRSFSFPVMNREKRHAVHDMCEVFGVESVAYDAEPQRNIVATAYKDRSWLPAQSIMEVVKREGAGTRRVPGPAWGVKRT